MSCPFYGQCALPVLRTTHATGGNQCALIMEASAPCQMEMQGKPVNWESCRAREVPGWRDRAEKILEWAKNDDGRKLLFQFRYPD